MVRIRLSRVGAKKQPTYRVVVADRESPRDGRIIENVGLFNPRTEPPTVELAEDRILYWLSQGAQPSEAVERFVKKAGLREKLAEMRKAPAPQA
jgi:small subunit ribosomal protein S16